jgi:hypothetical protein
MFRDTIWLNYHYLTNSSYMGKGVVGKGWISGILPIMTGIKVKLVGEW